MSQSSCHAAYAQEAMLALGQALKAWRQARGLKQAEAAALIHVKRRTISDVEHGKAALRLEKLFEYASALDTPLWACFPPDPQSPLGQLILRLQHMHPAWTIHLLNLLTLAFTAAPAVEPCPLHDAVAK